MHDHVWLASSFCFFLGGGLWVYWGVRRREVARAALVGGVGLATLSLGVVFLVDLVWSGEAWRAYRGIAGGCGLAVAGAIGLVAQSVFPPEQ